MPVQKTFKLSSAARLLLLVPALLALIAFVFIFRWGIANSAATRVNVKELAEFTTAWAPDDPQTHYTLALISEKSFLPEDLDKAVRSYEQAAALSPFDHRYWLPFAQARERAGDADGAEKTMRRALELAPNYAQIHWALGNMLLRQGRMDEAFAEMRFALEKNPAFTLPAVTAAMQFSDDAPAALAEKLGNSPAIKAAMALSLARGKKFDDSINIWNSIDNAERGNFKEQGAELSKTFLEDKKFRYARLVSDHSVSKVGSDIVNPGFEDELNISDPSPFEWQIADGPQPRIGFDEQQKYGGKRSLGIFFAKGSGKEFRTISQTVLIPYTSRYTFNVFYRSEISTTGGIRWEIVDAADGQVLGSTEDIKTANNTWESLSTAFTAAPDTEAVIIRLVRAPGCQSCSIEGKLWFDNFSMAGH